MSTEANVNVEKLPQTEDTNTQNVEILSGYASIEQFTKDGYKVLMEAIKNSNALPNGRDWNFYNAHESFIKIVNEEGNTVLKQINSILRNNKIEGNIRNRVLEEKTELMIEANDMILERIANNLDEINGIRKTVVEPVLIQTVSAQLPINGSWNRVNNATFSVSSSIPSERFKKNGNAIRLLTGKNIVRPQKFFKDKIINSSKYPWEPRIKEKPNSQKPLAIFLEKTENGEEFSHPYEYELERFTPVPAQLKRERPVIPIEIKDTPLVEINQPEQLDKLIETLRECKEIAVDLEHHSYRSFMGITCLMQISTREKDYLIDTLDITFQIFHGADMDIQWLQRDLSLYVVNMFDTYQAAKQLGYPGLSLAYLMQRFCNFIPNKHFQLADWRIRPLPEELKSYAREDTHYLIYIYQMLKNELINKANGQDNILLSVIKSSTETCKKRYFRSVLTEDSHLDFYRKCKRLFDNRQLYALKELYKWRDQISREEDESTGYVLPNHMLLQISESLPREMQGILACCNPIPPLVRANLLELHQIILRAKEQPLEKPILKEDTRARGTTLKISKINVDSPLHCPHDLTKTSDFRDDLPILLGNKSLDMRNFVNSKLEIENCMSTYTVFNKPENLDEKDVNEATEKHSFTFLGPFERYKLVKPFIQAEEEKLAAEKAEAEQIITETSVSEDIQEDTRTDEERIESIRKHFLKLSRPAAPVEKEILSDQTLVQMGGSKKRKRDPSPQEEYNYYPPEACLQTTIPNLNIPNKIVKLNGGSLVQQKQRFNKKNRNNQKKQRQNTPNQQNQSGGIQKKKNKNKHRGNHGQQIHGEQSQTNYGEQNQGHSEHSSQRDNHPGQSNSGFQNESDRQEHNSFHIDKSRSNSNRLDHMSNPRGRFYSGRGKQKNKNKRGGQQTTQARQNQDFTPYDYSTVDFRQFQGGSGGTERPQELRSTFKSKGKKKSGNKSNNRGSTFGNRGRSGGRGR
ncbi:hypothetical protein NQ314_011518 [Rhamnusium bicolor]|uniref:HRDC domain-containing protein n=1 Tax=Rhamnusium bicolor TaxID=1586634 RepID=A0AAV8XHE1_9CUCU|nr:hypothetical protein NQ314_011518 [Rhamnusium bicolor]